MIRLYRQIFLQVNGLSQINCHIKTHSPIVTCYPKLFLPKKKIIINESSNNDNNIYI